MTYETPLLHDDLVVLLQLVKLESLAHTRAAPDLQKHVIPTAFFRLHHVDGFERGLFAIHHCA